jgi:hypothetical protein
VAAGGAAGGGLSVTTLAIVGGVVAGGTVAGIKVAEQVRDEKTRKEYTGHLLGHGNTSIHRLLDVVDARVHSHRSACHQQLVNDAGRTHDPLSRIRARSTSSNHGEIVASINAARSADWRTLSWITQNQG